MDCRCFSIAFGERLGKGKNVDLEVRAVDSIRPTLYAIDKGIPKLSGDRCNLVAVVDDLFISPTGLPPGWIDQTIQTHLAVNDHKILSGVFLLKAALYGGPVEYLYRFVPNPQASLPLSDAVLQGWIASNFNRQGPRWSL